MSKFLFYSDYIRFFEDLNSCRELENIADLLKGFIKFHIRDNPSIYSIALDALWNVYPEYDLECNVEVLFNYDIDSFTEYSNPKLEFAAQYFHYLATQGYEIEFKIIKDLHSGYDEDQSKDSNNSTVFKETETEYNIRRPSFGIHTKYISNLVSIIQAINEEVEISRDKKFPEKFAELLVQKDLSSLNIEEREFSILCQTNLFVFIFENLEKTFGKKINRYLFDEYCSFTMINSDKRLSSSTFNVTKSRNGKTPPVQYGVITELCNRYAPSNKRS